MSKDKDKDENLEALKQRFIDAVDNGGNSVDVYTVMSQLIARDISDAEEDADKRDFYRLFLSLRKELDKKDIPEDKDEDRDYLDRLSLDTNSWSDTEEGDDEEELEDDDLNPGF